MPLMCLYILLDLWYENIAFVNFAFSCASGTRYVLGAVETFLKAVPAAGIFRGYHEILLVDCILF